MRWTMFSLFRGINGRLLLIPLVAALALAVVGAASVRTIDTLMLDEREARARVVVEAALSVVELYEQRAQKGEMPADAAQTAAKDAVRAIRFDGSEYALILDT